MELAAKSTAKAADPVSKPSQWLGFGMRVFVANYSTMDDYYHKTFSTINLCATSFVIGHKLIGRSKLSILQL